MRVAVTEVDFFEGHAYEINTEDGPSARFDYFLHATVDGKDWVHPHPHRWRGDAEAMVERVRSAGTVDLALWVEAPPRMSLEERFAAYAQQEAEVRMGVRPEWDMYHGID